MNPDEPIILVTREEFRQRIIKTLGYLTICCAGNCHRSKEAKALIKELERDS